MDRRNWCFLLSLVAVSIVSDGATARCRNRSAFYCSKADHVIMVDSSDNFVAMQKATKKMESETVIGGKKVHLGVPLDDIQNALGKPRKLEPSTCNGAPAIRLLYVADGNIYLLYFTLNERQQVTLAFIDIRSGY